VQRLFVDLLVRARAAALPVLRVYLYLPDWSVRHSLCATTTAAAAAAAAVAVCCRLLTTATTN